MTARTQRALTFGAVAALLVAMLSARWCYRRDDDRDGRVSKLEQENHTLRTALKDTCQRHLVVLAGASALASHPPFSAEERAWALAHLEVGTEAIGRCVAMPAPPVRFPPSARIGPVGTADITDEELQASIRSLMHALEEGQRQRWPFVDDRISDLASVARKR